MLFSFSTSLYSFLVFSSVTKDYQYPHWTQTPRTRRKSRQVWHRINSRWSLRPSTWATPDFAVRADSSLRCNWCTFRTTYVSYFLHISFFQGYFRGLFIDFRFFHKELSVHLIYIYLHLIRWPYLWSNKLNLCKYSMESKISSEDLIRYLGTT